MNTVGFNLVGPRLRDARVESRRSREAIRAALKLEGISLEETSFSRLEAGERRVSDFEIISLCRVLGTSVAELFGERSELIRRPLDEASDSSENAKAEIQAIRRGVSMREFRTLAKTLVITPSALARSLGISPREMSRKSRRRTKLTPVESEKVKRVTRVLGLAKQLFATSEIAAQWMILPEESLWGCSPLDLLDTDVGAARVETFIRDQFAGTSNENSAEAPADRKLCKRYADRVPDFRTLETPPVDVNQR